MIRPAAHPPKAWPKDHGSYCPICREFVPAFYLRRCDEPENPVTLTPVEDCHAAGEWFPFPECQPPKTQYYLCQLRDGNIRLLWFSILSGRFDPPAMVQYWAMLQPKKRG